MRVWLLALWFLGCGCFAFVTATSDTRIAAGILGPRAPAFVLPVLNSLTLVTVSGRHIVVGETDATAQYQMMSDPIPVQPGTRRLQVQLSGVTEKGGLYYALIGERGSFLGEVRTCSLGPIEEEGPLVAPKGNKSVRIVLGNLGQGLRSRWRIERVELNQAPRLTGRDLERMGFSGSVWKWALEVLQGARRPSKDEDR